MVKQGHTVIGIEAVQKAIVDFFKENNISYERKTVDGNGHCYMVNLCVIVAKFFIYSHVRCYHLDAVISFICLEGMFFEKEG